MAALNQPGFPEYLECIKHAIRQGGEYSAALDRDGNWNPVARDPLLGRALARMVTKDKILVPVGRAKLAYKLLPAFEKLDTFFWFGLQWSSISTPNLRMFLDNNFGSISHEELIQILEHKVKPQILPTPDPLGEASPRTSPRGTKRRRLSSNASESSHASNLSSPIPIPTPHSSPPSTMKSTASQTRKVRESESVWTTLQFQVPGPTLSEQGQLEQKLSEMPWIRSGFENFHEKYPNDEFELVMDDGALKMKCHDCPKNLIKAEYGFSRGLSNVEAHFKNQTHRNAVKKRIHAKIPPRSSSQSVQTASMEGKEKIHLLSEHMSSSSPVVANPRLSPSSPNHTPAAISHTPTTVNPTPPTHNSIPTATSHTPATANLTPAATNLVPAVPNPILAVANPANPAPALSQPSKSHFPVIPGAEPNAAAKLGADSVRKSDADETFRRRKRPRTQLDDHKMQRLKDLEEAQNDLSLRVADDRNYIGDALLDTESKLTVQRQSINVLKETAKIQTSLIQELKAEFSSKVAQEQESIEILKETMKTQTSLIQELKEELSAARKRGREYRESAKDSLNQAIDALESKVTVQQECLESFKQTATTQTSLALGLREALSLAMKRAEEYQRENDARVQALIEASRVDESYIQELKEEFSLALEEIRKQIDARVGASLASRDEDDARLRAEKKKKVRDLRERILQAKKRGEELRAKKSDRLDAIMKPIKKQTGQDRAALDAEIRALAEAEQQEKAYVSNLETHLLELFCED